MWHYKGFTVSTLTFPTSTKCFDTEAQFLTRHTELAQCTQLPTINRGFYATHLQNIINKRLFSVLFLPPLKLHTSQEKGLIEDNIHKEV